MEQIKLDSLDKLIQLDKIRGPFEMGLVAGRNMKRIDHLQDDGSSSRKSELRIILLIRAKDLQRCSEIFMNTHADKLAKVVADKMNNFRYTV